MKVIKNFLTIFFLHLIKKCRSNEEEYRQFLTSSTNFFHNLFFDIGYGIRNCIENQNLYPYEKMFIDKGDKNYINDLLTGIFILFSLIILSAFTVIVFYDIFTTPIRVIQTIRRWYKMIKIEEKNKKKKSEEKKERKNDSN